MRVKKGMLPQTKSYTEISDIFGPTPFNNIFYCPQKHNKEHLADTTAESDKKSILKNSSKLNVYVTCEKYHGLNGIQSHKSIGGVSTSTIFCDLDDIAKRHSFHCLTEVSISNANILKVMKLPVTKNGFKGKSNAIIQDCATQMHPKVLAKDSMELNTKKKKKNHPQNDFLSSEIFLRDGKYGKYGKKQYHNIDFPNNHQKVWSYAKYRTEYTKTIPEEKRNKKKERGKRTEDPCPCQLFSYACPCTDEKSLCELAENSRGVALADQITSTTKMIYEKKKKPANEYVREDKIINTNISEKTEDTNPQTNSTNVIADKQDIPVLTDLTIKTSPKCRHKPKKIHKVICPKCKAKVEVISATEEEESIQLDDSSLYHSKELTPTYNCSTSFKANICKNFDDGDVCNHEPRCELVPVCQILPTDDIVLNTKTSRKRTSTKSIPRVIRITKACRHHPPCTVVPSCQRANVLRNNCEYIPPCLHRPRCVNLPLCVPFSKSIHYEEPCKHMEEEEAVECHQVPQCKYIPECQHDSIENNVDCHYNTVTRVQNACGYAKGNWTSAYVSNPRSPMYPTQISTSPCCSYRSNKSCQYENSECECVYSSQMAKGSGSVDAIIFIRDVGCQFKNKTFSPKNTVVRSKTSSASFDVEDVKTGSYYTAVHTLRCEDKFTNPKSGMESISTVSTTSMEVDSQCPSHGRHSSRNHCTGFNPSQLYTTAFAKSDKPPFISEKHKDLSRSDVVRYRETFPVKSRKNVKGKYRKVIAAKRRRRSKTSNLVTCASEKT